MGASEKAGIDQNDGTYDTQKGMRVEEVEHRTDGEPDFTKPKSGAASGWILAECQALSKTPLGISMMQDEWHMEQIGKLLDDGTRMQPPLNLKKTIGLHCLMLFMVAFTMYSYLYGPPDVDGNVVDGPDVKNLSVNGPGINLQKHYFVWIHTIVFPPHVCQMWPYWMAGASSGRLFLVWIYIIFTQITPWITDFCDRILWANWSVRTIFLYGIVRQGIYLLVQWNLPQLMWCGGSDGMKYEWDTGKTLASCSIALWAFHTVVLLYLDILFIEKYRNYTMESKKLFALMWLCQLYDTVFGMYFFVESWTFFTIHAPYGPYKYYGEEWDSVARYDKNGVLDETGDQLTGDDIYTMANPKTYGMKGEWPRKLLPWMWSSAPKTIQNRTVMQLSTVPPILFLGLIGPAMYRNHKHGNRNYPGDVVVYAEDDTRVQRPVEYMMLSLYFMAMWVFRLIWLNQNVKKALNNHLEVEVPCINLMTMYIFFFLMRFAQIYGVRTAVGKNHYLPQILLLQWQESLYIFGYTFWDTRMWTGQWALSMCFIALYCGYRDAYLQKHVRSFCIRMGWDTAGALQDLLWTEEVAVYDMQQALAQFLALIMILTYALTETIFELADGDGPMYTNCYKSGTGACNVRASSRLAGHLLLMLLVGLAAIFTARVSFNRLDEERAKYVSGQHHKKIDSSLIVCWKKPRDWIPRSIFHPTTRDYLKNHLKKLHLYIVICPLRSVASMHVLMLLNYPGSLADSGAVGGKFWVGYLQHGIYTYRMDLW